VIARLPTLLAGGFVCVCLGATSAQQAPEPQSGATVSIFASASIGKVDMSARPDGLTITIAVSAPVVPTADRATNPDRLIFDFPGCQLKGGNRRTPVNQGPVKALRLAMLSAQPAVARIVVDLTEPLDFQVKPAQSEVVIEIPFAKAEAQPVAPIRAPTQVPPPTAAEKEKIAPSAPDAPTVQPEPAGLPASTGPIIVSQPQEKKSAAAIPTPQKQPAPAIVVPSYVPPTSPPLGAYGMMAKAKELNVGDLESLEQKSETGDPEAETTLALAYHSGVLLKQNDTEAVRLLRKAADRGWMAAEESLGIFLEGGIGVERPVPAEAIKWYEKAALQGSMDAATNMALMYANGIGAARDTMQAVKWFHRAADGGDATGQYNLALMYIRGEGVPHDYKEAIRWLTAAADQNLVPAILSLADLFLQPPTSELPADLGKAIRYYEKAADLGSAGAQTTLGTIFARGLTGKPDYDLAVKWYQKAAEQGDPDGQLGLGVSYATGHGVPEDFEEARRLLMAAADRGQTEAQYDFAIMCEEGKGAPADLEAAAHYYQMAADRGMVKAQYRYGLLLSKDPESRSSRIAAYKWLTLAEGFIKESSAVISDLRKSLNEQEIAEAEREVDNWRSAHKPAAR